MHACGVSSCRRDALLNRGVGEKNDEKAAERLSEASKSMVVFENTSEYESRRTLMVSLQNQLEAALSSALVAAVNSRES